MVPHGESELSPDEQISGNIPNFGDLKSFGCQVYIKYPGIRRNNIYNNIKNGILLDIQPTPLRYVIGIYKLSW